MSHAKDAASASISIACEQSLQAVTETEDPHEQFRVATDLSQELRTAADDVARQRGPAALRIKHQQKLTLRGLADRIGVAPSRAERLVNAAKAGGPGNE